MANRPLSVLGPNSRKEVGASKIGRCFGGGGPIIGIVVYCGLFWVLPFMATTMWGRITHGSLKPLNGAQSSAGMQRVQISEIYSEILVRAKPYSAPEPE